MPIHMAMAAWRNGTHVSAVILEGSTGAALLLLLFSDPGAAASSAQGPSPARTTAGVMAPAAEAPVHPLRIELAASDDPDWELTRVDLLLDGTPLEAPPATDGLDGARPVWSGVVAPGPHNLAALLFFRPRSPADPSREVGRTVRVEAEHRFHARPIRPLVLLITPARPAPPSPADQALTFAVAELPSER